MVPMSGSLSHVKPYMKFTLKQVLMYTNEVLECQKCKWCAICLYSMFCLATFSGFYDSNS